MEILVNCQSISKSWSARPLFKDLSFAVEDGQKIGLIGPNGSGKSTLLKIIAGEVEPDSGSVVRRRQLRPAYVPQEETFDPDATIEAILSAVAQGLPFQEHERAASIDSTIARLKFPDRNAKAGLLSGGWRKRLALACGLVQKPDLLLLDEPTNHLDLQGVLWLESLLNSLQTPYIVVTHDRAFLENISTRIIELNPAYPQGFLSFDGAYSEYLLMREEQLSAQQNLEQALASKARREIAWLQRGARARQTKARGRIKDAEKLFAEFAEVKQRNIQSTAQIGVEFDASGRKTKELLIAKSIAKGFGDRTLFAGLNVILTTNLKLGLVGRNGSGKSTLIKTLVGDLSPDSGTIKRAEDLKIVWFDQNREQLDQTQTLAQALSPAGDAVVFRGRSLHVSTWAKKFLFRSDQLNMPVSYLSGGEQARILLANLMLKPADILILDEPTNDLDIPSLEVLEDSLTDFAGTVILVTHDRMMLDSVSSRILALDGSGGADYFADYDQFEQVANQYLEERKEARVTARDTESASKSAARSKTGLSTAEKRELANMPEKIEAAEKEISRLQSEMEKPAVASNYPKLQDLMKQIESRKIDLDSLFRRWEDLEARSVQQV